MRITAIVLGLLLSFSAFAQLSAQPGAQPDPELELERIVTGDIEIAADGSVHGYKLDKGVSTAIDQALDTRIRSWKFEPITVDGRAVIAKTHMRIALHAAAADGGYAFRINQVWFGTPERRSTTKPPRYPEDALRAGVGAKVILVLRLDAAGNVVDVHGEQVSLTGRAPEKIAEDWRRKFLTPSIAAAKRWKFDVSETIDGEAVGSSVRVPVTFTVGSTKPVDRWNAFVPGPYRPAPWVASNALATEGIDKLEDGDLQALDSRFKLKSGGAGTLL